MALLDQKRRLLQEIDQVESSIRKLRLVKKFSEQVRLFGAGLRLGQVT